MFPFGQMKRMAVSCFSLPEPSRLTNSSEIMCLREHTLTLDYCNLVIRKLLVKNTKQRYQIEMRKFKPTQTDALMA